MVKWLVALVACSLFSGSAVAQPRPSTGSAGPASAFSQILGRPTDRAVTISVLSAATVDAFVEYGTTRGSYTKKTPVRTVNAGTPAEFELGDLSPSTAYFYRVQTKAAGEVEFTSRDAAYFRTQRKQGETFTFGVQGDSHPERLGKMYDPELYIQTMQHVAKDAPDFYFLMGDDFSIERLIERGNKSQSAVDAIYAHQRGFLGLVGKSTPLMLVNGNHEQAAKYLLDGTANNFAVLAGKARTNFFPLPAPGGIYSGNAEPVEHIGLLRDYYAWEWGDALFVVIDPYWHSDVAVDNEAGTRAPQQPVESNRDAKRRARGNDAGGNQAEQLANRQGKGNRDLWQITLGEAQYQWLGKTLHESKAKFKFVFSHHVSGTGRGGVEVAGLYEWGGEDRRGVDRFFQMRPKWEKPIHDLLRDTGVTIFFQGHDHLYARQELDGVIYQTCPNPADPTFTAFNAQAYKSGDIFPNSGYLRVTVTPDSAKVEYVRSFRPQDEGEGKTNGSIAHSYVVKPREPTPPAQSKPPEPKR
ncbi:MAG: metallophosphoesterase family protein [Phycisphaerales bacterium]|nr:metallophosphoesterase family protein [Phycisphaerales bacterium]